MDDEFLLVVIYVSGKVTSSISFPMAEVVFVLSPVHINTISYPQTSLSLISNPFWSKGIPPIWWMKSRLMQRANEGGVFLILCLAVIEGI
jgi:hypothetical protein